MNKKQNHKTRVKYATSSTFKSFGAEKNDGKSLTVQDESYTVRELLEKHTQGLMPPVGLMPEYDYENATHDDDVTFRRPDLDLTDIDEMSRKVKKTRQKMSRQEKDKKEKETIQNDRSSTAKDEAKND